MNIKPAVVSISLVMAACGYIPGPWLIQEANAGEKWSDADKAREIVFVALQYKDWSQTRYISDHPDMYYEKNAAPIIGKHPNHARVDAWFAFTTVANIFIVNALPSKYRPWFQYLSIGLEAHTVHANIKIGIK